MRFFQILGEVCHWDATNAIASLEEAEQRFASDIVIVEAPDYVREGWGFDATAEGEARFIRPEPPEGWLYNEETGTFYQESNDIPASEEPDIWDELAAAYAEGVNNA